MNSKYPSSSPKFWGNIILLLLVIGHGMFLQAQPTLQQGFLDTRNFDFKSDKLALSGEWLFFDGQLVSPDDALSSPSTVAYLPQLWNESKSSGQGYATYLLQVIVSAQSEALALELPQFYSSYQLWVNGKLLAANGKVGKTRTETTPQWLPQTVSLAIPSDTLNIVIQVANFHHYKGGLKDPIYLGSNELLQHQRSLAVVSNLTESILLGFIGLIFLTLYLITAKKKIIIYFALLCLTWSIRVVFSNLYTFISFFPDFDWDLLVKIEYLTLFLTMIWAILFLGRVFSKEDNKIIKYLLVGSNVAFIMYSLLTDPISFTRWLPVYLSVCGLLLVYATVLVLRALINERLGAGFLTFSILLGIGIFSYDVFAYEGFFDFHPVVFGICYILIFLLMAVVLLMHLRIIKSKIKPSSRLTFNDLYKDNPPAKF